MRRPIVLVHGAWHGAWCFDRVVDLLTSRGHSACAVHLPLDGAAGDIAEARSIIEARPGAVVLGHSYGGMVITHACVGLEVAHLVYLSALMPDEGEDLVATIGAAPPAVALQRATIVDDEGFIAIDPALAIDAFYDDCDPDEARAVSGKLRRQRIDGFPVLSRPAPWHDVPATYVVCQDDKALHPELQRQFSKRAGMVVEWPGAHSPFLTRPAEVAALLAERSA